MSWGLLIEPPGSPWTPWLSVLDVSPAQGAWYDASRLLDPQPRHRLRLRAASDGSAYLILDLGAPGATLTHVALVSTTLSIGTLRVRGSASDQTVTTSLAFDTSAVPLADLAEPRSGTIVLPVTSSGATQYLRLDLADQAPEGFVDIGLFFGGAATIPSRNYAFGAVWGRLDGSQRDVSADTGVSFGRAAAAPRFMDFSVPHPASETAWGTASNPLTERLRICAANQCDVLVMRDTAETDAAMLSRTSIWGRLEQPGGDVIEMFDVARVRWRIVERI